MLKPKVMVCLVWAVIFSRDLEKSPYSRWLCWGISLRYIGMFSFGHRMSHFLGQDLLVCVGAKIPHSTNFVLDSENVGPTTSSPPLCHVQGKKRALICFTPLYHVPSNTPSLREHRALSNIGFQSLKPPTSLTRRCFGARSSLSACCSLLGPNHPLSPFVGEMLTLAISQSMHTSWAALRDAPGFWGRAPLAVWCQGMSCCISHPQAVSCLPHSYSDIALFCLNVYMHIVKTIQKLLSGSPHDAVNSHHRVEFVGRN